jgi:hypothetical protein
LLASTACNSCLLRKRARKHADRLRERPEGHSCGAYSYNIADSQIQKPKTSR